MNVTQDALIALRRFRRQTLLGTVLTTLSGVRAIGAPTVDTTQLAPPATNHIEFNRDINPLLERSCFRCHGPERPKSGFSLATRAAALKGGNNGVDILPGDSAGSPLIHYVAGLSEEVQMPPPGKGEALTAEEIGRLRAWIDQGVEWSTNAPPPAVALELAPTLGATVVSGDEKKFRERYWTKEGWNGGAEEFRLTDQLAEGSKLTFEGRVLVDDYRTLLTLEKNDVGFVRFGWEQFRKYSDDTGGYFPEFTPSTFALDRDLHLDIGRAWVDFGLALPRWPRLVLGYEYQYRQGDESTLQWGAVTGGTETRNVYPAAKTLDEHVHILKFDLEHDLAGVQIEDRFRGEFYDLHTEQFDTRAYNLGDPGPSRLDDVRQSYQYFQGANTLRLDKAFTDWLSASAGYLYSKLNADATFALDTQFPLGPPPFYAVDRWQSQDIVLERETHSLNASALLGPWQGLSLSAGVLSDWTRQSGYGLAEVQIVTPFFTFGGPATLDGDYDTTTVEENVALRYTRIPFTVLFAEARLQQESRGIAEDTTGGFHDFMQRTDASGNLQDFRAGFDVSPWQALVLNAQYRNYREDWEYNHLLDVSAHDAYPAFIRARHAEGDDVEVKLTSRPCVWLKTTFSYKYEIADYQTATDPASETTLGDLSPGGWLDAAHSHSHTYSLSAVLTPWRRLAVSGTFSYQETSLAAFANGDPSIVPYRGDMFSTLASATYTLNQTTDLVLSCTHSQADYSQNNYADGLPLGIRYHENAVTAGLARRISKNVSARLRYGFYCYTEPSSGGVNDYTAHALFGTLVVRLP